MHFLTLLQSPHLKSYPENCLLWIPFHFKVRKESIELWLDGKSVGNITLPSAVSRIGRIGFLFTGRCKFELRKLEMKILRTIPLEQVSTAAKRFQKTRAEALKLIESGNWEQGRDQLLSIIGDAKASSTIIGQVSKDLFRVAQREEWESLQDSFEEWIGETHDMTGGNNKVSTSREGLFNPNGIAQAKGLSMKLRIDRLGSQGSIGFEMWNTLEKKPIHYVITKEEIQLKVVETNRKSQYPLPGKATGSWTNISAIQFRDVVIFFMDGKWIWKTTPGSYRFYSGGGFYFQDVDAEIERMQMLP